MTKLIGAFSNFAKSAYKWKVTDGCNVKDNVHTHTHTHTHMKHIQNTRAFAIHAHTHTHTHKRHSHPYVYHVIKILGGREPAVQGS